MSKSNKAARKDLENIYGKKDMFTEARIEEQIDELNKTRKKKIKTYREFKEQCRFTRSKEKSLEKMLSFHHLRHRSDNGKAEAENGALLSALPHSYLHSLPREDEEIINNMLREYKANFSVNSVSLSLTDRGLEIHALEPTEDMKLPPEIEAGEIPVEPMTPEEQAKYEEYKRQRNARICKDKFKYNPALDTSIERPKAVIDKEWQREIFFDNLDEIRY